MTLGIIIAGTSSFLEEKSCTIDTFNSRIYSVLYVVVVEQLVELRLVVD